MNMRVKRLVNPICRKIGHDWQDASHNSVYCLRCFKRITNEQLEHTRFLHRRRAELRLNRSKGR